MIYRGTGAGSTWEDFEGDVGDRADVLTEEQPISWGTLRAASLSLIAASAESGSVNSLTMFAGGIWVDGGRPGGSSLH